MARRTIATTIIERMQDAGYTYVGMTSGWYSFDKRSNLTAFLNRNGLTRDDVTVEIGAKKQRRTEGTQLIVFRNPQSHS